MYHPILEEALSFQQDYNIVPICREIYADMITPISLLQKISSISPNYYLLEGIEEGKNWGRYSFIGFEPIVTARCKNGVVALEGDIQKQVITTRPMDVLREVLKNFHSPCISGMPPFTGGFVGYFSYEMINYAEPTLKLKESEFDDFHLMLFDKIIAYDHLKQKISVVVNMRFADGKECYQKACKKIDEIVKIIKEPASLSVEEVKDVSKCRCNLSEEEFCKLVESVKEYITDGDIFQAVISRRFEITFKSSLLNVYRVLRTSNPSPYMYLMNMDGVQYVGTSPETLIKLKDSKLITYPVAGTRPRGENYEEDMKLEKELLRDEKELAEHNMLVDLARNDIGKVAKFSTVKVEEYMKIHRYSQVMHITSVVSGVIREDKDAFDAIEAMLPAGTLSGAPKIRACEIINKFEPTARGIYGGAIGFVDFLGNMDTCIAIRTAIKKDEIIYVQAGGGIVADSIPYKEYLESQNKAGAIIDAIKRTEEVEN